MDNFVNNTLKFIIITSLTLSVFSFFKEINSTFTDLKCKQMLQMLHWITLLNWTVNFISHKYYKIWNIIVYIRQFLIRYRPSNKLIVFMIALILSHYTVLNYLLWKSINNHKIIILFHNPINLNSTKDKINKTESCSNCVHLMPHLAFRFVPTENCNYTNCMS